MGLRRIQSDDDYAKILRFRRWDVTVEKLKEFLHDDIAENFYISEDDGITAMCSVISYGTYAWIGKVYIRKDKRKRGLGTELLSLVEEKLNQAGTKIIYCYILGRVRGFYEKNGYFYSGLETTRYFLESVKTDRTYLHSNIRPIAEFELDELLKFDKARTNTDRSKLLTFYYEHYKGDSLCFAEDGDLKSYLIHYYAPMGTKTGPLVADNDEVALSLIEASVSQRGKTPLKFEVLSNAEGFIGIERHLNLEIIPDKLLLMSKPRYQDIPFCAKKIYFNSSQMGF